MSGRQTLTSAALAALLVIAGCGSDDTSGEVAAVPAATEVPAVEVTAAEPAPTAEPTIAPTADETENDGLFPTVEAVDAQRLEGDSWRFSVTLRSEYDTPERYADAWRVLDADGNELGIRVLAHDHANEQPFTRSTKVDVPADITVVYIEGRDQLNGWSGERIELELVGDAAGTTVVN